MTTRPIIFNGPMVRALLDGRKIQTRRLLNQLQGFGRITELGFCIELGDDNMKDLTKEYAALYGSKTVGGMGKEQ